VKNTGDGLLAEFQSVVDAMRCAVGVQRGMAERNAAIPPEKRIEFRVGINLGDVIVEEHDIFGDGVNVAARLEALAEPGGVLVSNTVHEHVRDRLPFAFEDLGEQQVKNIARPVRVYRVSDIGGGHQIPSVLAMPTLPLPDKPLVAVLPFTNMSGDPEQEFFSDGIAEDIITALSHRVRASSNQSETAVMSLPMLQPRGCSCGHHKKGMPKGFTQPMALCREDLAWKPPTGAFRPDSLPSRG
jgi:adenylate cyclase